VPGAENTGGGRPLAEADMPIYEKTVMQTLCGPSFSFNRERERNMRALFWFRREFESKLTATKLSRL
jgi:hypothetical protein